MPAKTAAAPAEPAGAPPTSRTSVPGPSPGAEPREPSRGASEPAVEPAAPSAPWRDEIAERLEDHRRRRSRLQANAGASRTLDLAFGEPAVGEAAEVPDAELVESSGEPDPLDFHLSGPRAGAPALDSVPLEKPVEDIRVLTSAAVEAGEAPLARPELESEPVEIILESSPLTSLLAPSARRAPESKHVAPVGRRFVAGLVDTGILLLGGVLFSFIFWIVGGHASPNPLNFAVFGTLATLFVLAYFGLFTALSSSTPGLLSMSLEIRSLDGGPPSPQESFWRAFGYLISLASLLLGFVWSLVDGDHLTWHDHMSGTFITRMES